MDVHQVDVPFDVFDVPVVHQIFLMYKLTSIRTSNGSRMLGGEREAILQYLKDIKTTKRSLQTVRAGQYYWYWYWYCNTFRYWY